ncbi:uncharacterized protein B0P05DRAFT_523080, partial [Gilbertella persicaria]|uniref:uncharacterized protein n=1 Tax=Gilbertella persicaria TaxID=101096 RepID=UPI00221F0D8E
MSMIKVVVITNTHEPVEFKFLLEKLNWDSLVQFIQCSTSSIDPPLVLYYKWKSDTESLENQQQLAQLLQDLGPVSLLRFYTSPGEVLLPVSTPPVSATFARLGELVEVHKNTIESSRSLVRWIGIFASAIAFHGQDKEFEDEFRVLETLIQTKSQKQSGTVHDAEEDMVVVSDTEEVTDPEDKLLELLMSLDLSGSRCRGRKFGRGRHSKRGGSPPFHSFGPGRHEDHSPPHGPHHGGPPSHGPPHGPPHGAYPPGPPHDAYPHHDGGHPPSFGGPRSHGFPPMFGRFGWCDRFDAPSEGADRFEGRGFPFFDADQEGRSHHRRGPRFDSMSEGKKYGKHHRHHHHPYSSSEEGT